MLTKILLFIKKYIFLYLIFTLSFSIISYILPNNLYAKNKKTKIKTKINKQILEDNSNLSNSNVISDDEYIYKKGLMYYENAEFEKAIDFFKYIKENRPNSIYYDMAIYLCGESYFKNQNYNKAIECFNFLIKHCPNSKLCADAIHTLALYYKNQGLNKKAYEYYEILTKKYPDSFWSSEAQMFLKYNNLTFNANHNNTCKNINDTQNLKITLIKEPNEYTNYNNEDIMLYQDGLKFYENNNYDKAKWCFQTLILNYKNSILYANAYFMLGNCYLATSDIKAAIRFLSNALIHSNDKKLTFEITKLLANLLFIDEQYQLALKHFETLIEVENDPEKLIQYYFMLGECYNKINDYEKAAKAFAIITSIDVKKNIKKETVNTILNYLENTNLLSTTTKELIFNNNEINNKINEAIKMFYNQNYLKCISILEDVSLNFFNNEIVYWYLGLSYLKLEKYKQSIENFQKYISLISKDHINNSIEKLKNATSILAYIYLKIGRYEDALNQYKNLINIDPKSNVSTLARESIQKIELMKKRIENEK